MSKFFNLKSKKGFSLAYALVVCLFLMLIVGSITTVAIMQGNETGSDLNTRQAYISAKSGLNSVQTAFKNSTIDDSRLPSVNGDSVYCVLWQDASGNVSVAYFSDEAGALAFLKANPSYDIVGGEGTYYRITKDEKNVAGSIVEYYNITALNLTGKYNNNVTQNKGDLSVNITRTRTNAYVEMSPVSLGSMETTQESTELMTGGGGGSIGGSPNVPIMVGQQTAVNELRSNDYGNSAGKMLNNITKENGLIYYIGDTTNSIKTSRSVFPMVYDRMVKITTSTDRGGVASYNQGIYFLGGYSGPRIEVRDNNNNPLYQQIGQVSYYTEDTANQLNINCALVVIKNNVISFAHDSNRGKNIILHYYGDHNGKHNYYNGSYWVYVYLPNEIKVYSTNSNKNVDWNNDYTFTKGTGWYMIKDGDSLDNANNWKPLDASLLQGAENMCQYNQIMNYYNDGGTIHSGSMESEWSSFNDDRVQILHNDGAYNTDHYYNTGYSSSNGPDTPTSFFDISGVQDRSKMHIFFSANMSPTRSGYYNWYAGRTFSFTWCSTKDFEVNSNVNVSLVSANIIMNIGTGSGDGVDGKGDASREGWYDIIDVDTGNRVGNAINANTSKVIKRPKGSNGTFKLFGTQDNGSSMAYGTQKYRLSVPNSFKVVYYDGDVEKSYTIKGGVSTNGGYQVLTYSIDGSVDLFSDTAKTLFEQLGRSISYEESDIYGGGSWEIVVDPTYITITTTNTVDFDAPRGFTVAGSSGTLNVNTNGRKIVVENELGSCNNINVADSVTELYFANAAVQGSCLDTKRINDGTVSFTTPRPVLRLEVNSRFTVSKSGTVFLTFEPGVYEIPLESGEETTGINILDIENWKNRKKDGVNTSNYEINSSSDGGTSFTVKNGKEGSQREYY